MSQDEEQFPIAERLRAFTASLDTEEAAQPTTMAGAMQLNLVAEGRLCDLGLYADLLDLVANQQDTFSPGRGARFHARAGTLRRVDAATGGYRDGQHLTERRCGALLDWVVLSSSV